MHRTKWVYIEPSSPEPLHESLHSKLLSTANFYHTLVYWEITIFCQNQDVIYKPFASQYNIKELTDNADLKSGEHCPVAKVMTGRSWNFLYSFHISHYVT